MGKRDDSQLVVALDIGTSKVAALIGEPRDDGTIEVIGFGSHPSTGLKRGVVVNIDSTVNAISAAIEEAELMAGCEVHSAYTGIAGSHITSMNSHGIVAIRDREVMQSDVDRVIDAAKAVAIPADQKIIHIIPQEYLIDSQDGVREPVGMFGVRLEAKVHIVTGAVSAAQNIVKCVRRCGLNVGDIVLEQVASSYAVLSADEKELGVCLLDIGGGTTDMAIFVDGAIRHTAVVPIAGDQVTSDVAVALRTPMKHAERIKIHSGCALSDLVDMNETIEVPSVTRRSPRGVLRRALSQVIEARYEELFYLIKHELDRSGLQSNLAAGMVITGGASLVPGCVELAERILDIPVRIGLPGSVGGLQDVQDNPSYSTGVGLLLHGYQSRLSGRVEQNLAEGVGLFQRMRRWFQSNMNF